MLVEPGGVQTNFATTSMVQTAAHAAYDLPDSPSRLVASYVLQEEARRAWAKPEAVAASMLEVVRSQDIPARVPLGPDAWTFMKQEVELMNHELDRLKEFSEGPGNPRQVSTLDFLARK